MNLCDIGGRGISDISRSVDLEDGLFYPVDLWTSFTT